MAFSYSDKNFTVIGNLCFVHIILDGTESFIDIPRAIVDRMLYPRVMCTYPYLSSKGAIDTEVLTKGMGVAYIVNGRIF